MPTINITEERYLYLLECEKKCLAARNKARAESGSARVLSAIISVVGKEKIGQNKCSIEEAREAYKSLYSGSYEARQKSFIRGIRSLEVAGKIELHETGRYIVVL